MQSEPDCQISGHGLTSQRLPFAATRYGLISQTASAFRTCRWWARNQAGRPSRERRGPLITMFAERPTKSTSWSRTSLGTLAIRSTGPVHPVHAAHCQAEATNAVMIDWQSGTRPWAVAQPAVLLAARTPTGLRCKPPEVYGEICRDMADMAVHPSRWTLPVDKLPKRRCVTINGRQGEA